MFQTYCKTVIAAVLATAGSIYTNIAVSDSVSVPNEKLHYVKTGIGPLWAAPVFGDIFGGKHGTLIKMPKNFTSPVHTHSEDYHAVVVTGIIGNGLPNEVDLPLAAGSHWFQKGGEAHVTKCLSSTECVFYISQEDKFDFFIVD